MSIGGEAAFLRQRPGDRKPASALHNNTNMFTALVPHSDAGARAATNTDVGSHYDAAVAPWASPVVAARPVALQAVYAADRTFVTRLRRQVALHGNKKRGAPDRNACCPEADAVPPGSAAAVLARGGVWAGVSAAPQVAVRERRDVGMLEGLRRDLYKRELEEEQEAERAAEAERRFQEESYYEEGDDCYFDPSVGAYVEREPPLINFRLIGLRLRRGLWRLRRGTARRWRGFKRGARHHVLYRVPGVLDVMYLRGDLTPGARDAAPTAAAKRESAEERKARVRKLFHSSHVRRLPARTGWRSLTGWFRLPWPLGGRAKPQPQQGQQNEEGQDGKPGGRELRQRRLLVTDFADFSTEELEELLEIARARGEMHRSSEVASALAARNRDRIHHGTAATQSGQAPQQQQQKPEEEVKKGRPQQLQDAHPRLTGEPFVTQARSHTHTF